MTSNIGASEIKNDTVLGFDLHQEEKGSDENYEFAYERMRDKLTDELKDTLPPEFLNRLDGVIIFRSLSKNDIKKIVKLHLMELAKRLEKKNIEIEYSQQVQNYLAEESFNEEYGGRNVRRKVQDLVETEIAEKILDEKLLTSDKNKEKISVKIKKEKSGIVLET